MRVLILTDGPPQEHRLAADLDLLGHTIAVAKLTPEGLAAAQGTHLPDVALVDATTGLAAAAATCRANASSDHPLPLLVAVPESALAALKQTWGFDDWLLSTAQTAELETRLRLVTERVQDSGRVLAASVGDLSIDEETYVVRLRGKPLDLTYREFELLKFLAGNPRRVFTRSQLLQEVWGYDYYGGTRTVDVHIRRLRAKLGAEYEQLIGTVRGVGYKLDPQGAETSDDSPDEPDAPASPERTTSA